MRIEGFLSVLRIHGGCKAPGDLRQGLAVESIAPVKPSRELGVRSLA